MKDLEMIKAFAKLEGLTGFEVYKSNPHVAVREGWATLIPYNPITDLALNCAARDKYRVENDFDDGACFIYDQHGGLNVEVDFNGDIARASIECILKSKGLWK